jgi:palmitoyltransferase
MSVDRQLGREARLTVRVNQSMAVIIPLLEVGGMAFETYALVYHLCIRCLIQPRPDRIGPSKATGIALIVVYFILLALFALTFLRLLQVIWMHPGLISLGDPSSEPSSEKQTVSTKRFGLDAYVCDDQGSPLWCAKCHNWKPSRTHHSGAIERCVRRMDHYCPYAGGIISATSHKFFVQFLFYASFYTAYCLVVFAVFVADSIKHGSRPAIWIVGLALAGLFFLFSFGMFMTTIHNMARNMTTVEAAPWEGKVTHIALPIPSPSGPITVYKTRPEENPWDDGLWNNVRSVMGTRVVDWLNPFKMGPCADYSDGSGELPWGKLVRRMMDGDVSPSPSIISS